MAELPIRRSSPRATSGLAIERLLEALFYPALGLAGGAVVLIHWSERLISNGPFPEDMKKRFLGLYGAGPFGVLKLVVRPLRFPATYLLDPRLLTTSLLDDIYVLLGAVPEVWCRKSAPQAGFPDRRAHPQRSGDTASNSSSRQAGLPSRPILRHLRHFLLFFHHSIRLFGLLRYSSLLHSGSTLLRRSRAI